MDTSLNNLDSYSGAEPCKQRYIINKAITGCMTFMGYGVGVGRITSPIRSSAQFCSTKFGFTLRDIHVVSPQICSQNFFRRLDPGVAAISGAL